MHNLCCRQHMKVKCPNPAMPKTDAERGVLYKQLTCLCRVHYPAAVLSSLTSGQPNSPKPCRMAKRERRVLRLNLREALSGLTRVNRAAGLPACASDGPREDFACLICPCIITTPWAKAQFRGDAAWPDKAEEGGRSPA